jgi:hypothetical protein
MFVHIYFFEQFFDCLLIISVLLFVRTRTRFWLFFLSIELFEPNIVSLLHTMHVFTNLFSLPVVLIGSIAENMVREILCDKKFLFYYFIECGLEPFMLSDCATPLFEYTPSHTLKRGL